MRGRALLLGLLCPLSLPLVALAGPNLGGTLILHHSGFMERYHDPPYCGQSNLTDCYAAVTTSPGGTYVEAPIWFVIAAFPDWAAPRLKAMTFGIHYDPSHLTLIAYGPCIGDQNNGALEMPGSGWPGSDTGTAIVWQYTQTSMLVEGYWFTGYDYYGNDPTTFSVIPHPDPVLGGMFADDSIPSNLDPIMCYSTLGFNTPGELCCPPPGGYGACCFPTGECRLLLQPDCEQQGGSYLGDSTLCEPNPCPQPSACCLPTGECLVLTPAECEEHGGTYMGDGIPCEEDTCLPPPPNPVKTTTWGRIKAQYR
jgi:hypothetical protein